MLDLLAQVSVEHDVHRAGQIHLALERQTDILRDLAAPAVGADHVLGLDRVRVARHAIPNADRDAVGVLAEPQVLGVKANVRAACGGVADQDRLQQRLRQIAMLRRTRQGVVGMPGGMGAPRPHAPDLIARQACAEHRVAHQVIRCPDARDVLLDPQVAEDLDRPLVGDVGARRIRGPRVLGDHDMLHPQGGQRQRRGAARWPAPHHEDVGVQDLSHRTSPRRGER